MIQQTTVYGMYFTAFVTFFLPMIVLMVLGWMRRIDMKLVFVGFASFMLAQLIYTLVEAISLSLFGTSINSSLLLYSLWFGIVSTIVYEAVRIAIMNMQRKLTFNVVVSICLGYCATQAMLFVGIEAVNNLMMAHYFGSAAALSSTLEATEIGNLLTTLDIGGWAYVAVSISTYLRFAAEGFAFFYLYQLFTKKISLTKQTGILLLVGLHMVYETVSMYLGSTDMGLLFQACIALVGSYYMYRIWRKENPIMKVDKTVDEMYEKGRSA